MSKFKLQDKELTEFTDGNIYTSAHIPIVIKI